MGVVLLSPLIGTAQGFLGHRAAGELTPRLHRQGDLLVVEAHLERVDAVESVTAALEVSRSHGTVLAKATSGLISWSGPEEDPWTPTPSLLGR